MCCSMNSPSYPEIAVCLTAASNSASPGLRARLAGRPPLGRSQWLYAAPHCFSSSQPNRLHTRGNPTLDKCPMTSYICDHPSYSRKVNFWTCFKNNPRQMNIFFLSRDTEINKGKQQNMLFY